MSGQQQRQLAKRTPKPPTYLPLSLPLLLARRMDGKFHYGGPVGTPASFVLGVTRQLSPKCLVQNPQILTPQTQSVNRIHAIYSINVDKVESRFILAGGADAIVICKVVLLLPEKERQEHYPTDRHTNQLPVHNESHRLQFLLQKGLCKEWKYQEATRLR